MSKRKLDEHDIPKEDAVGSESADTPSFERFGLDPRLLQAIAKEKYSTPTPVQDRAIPLALEGKDISARAKTGSGKTAAYVLPILQSILKRKAHHRSFGTIALILVPTRELANQVTKTIGRLASFSSKDIHAIDLTQQISNEAQRALLSSSPEIVVATPARANAHINNSNLSVKNLVHIVVDEADLVLSYEYGQDFEQIVKFIPHGVQVFLASATLSTDVDTLKNLFSCDPVVLDLKDEEKESANINQYMVECSEDDKFLLAFALFKLKLIKGKSIVFVGDIDRCYRLKLFLEQFGIRSCVLNSELPVNCRIHVVEEFNKGVYDIIIATDEQEVKEEEPEKEKGDDGLGTEAESEAQNGQKTTARNGDITVNGEESEHPTPSNPAKEKPNKKQKRNHKSKKDRTYGISRGIDFHNVACVLNFDLPRSSRSYTHRIGRTARAGRTGIAMSFVIPASLFRKNKHTSFHGCANDEEVAEAIVTSQKANGREVQPYNFDMKKLTGFQYRVTSALKVVSPGAIREARIKEIREEFLKSDKLKRHLEENPDDLKYLRHDAELRPSKVMPHLRQIPEYLMPNGTPGKAGDQQAGFVPVNKSSENRIRKARERNKFRGKGKRGSGVKRANPLKTFHAKRKT